MKRIFWLFIFLFFIFMFTGCGQEAAEKSLPESAVDAPLAVNPTQPAEDTVKNEAMVNDTAESDGKEQSQADTDFLNTPEGQSVQATAEKAAEAFLWADATELAQYLLDPQEATHVVSNLTDLTEEVDGLTLKWGPDSLRAENKIFASYEFKRNNEDSYTYITLELTKATGEWKVKAIDYEK